MSVEAGEIAVDGGTLAYEVAGAGEPLVLLHGFSFDMRSWEPQFAPLAARFRVVRYDLRGFGKSSLPQGEYDHCGDLLRLLDHFGFERSVLVGLSLGANIALRFAIVHPERVAAQALASPGLPGHVWTDERPPDAAKAYAAAHGVEATKRFWTGHPFLASLDDYPAAQAAVRRMVDDYSGWHWSHSDPQAASINVAELLGDVAAPTLVLSGGRDAKGYREIAAILSQKIAGARLVTFGNAGHMLNLERPDAFTVAVGDFAAQATQDEAGFQPMGAGR